MNQAPFFNAQFFDDDGLPLSAGLLYTYASGTTTPQTTYQNQSGATTNANPIVLNARGECLLWLDPALEYTMLLKRADLTTVWTRDDVTGVAGGAGVVTSVNSETGAVILDAGDIGFTTGTATAWFVGTDVAAALDDIIDHIDDGFSASDIPITDGGSYYTATNVETALQEVAADVAALVVSSGVAELPSQTGNTGKFLTTNGSAASWSNEVAAQSGNSGKVLTTNGTVTSWTTTAANEIPDQGGNSGKFLTTNGSAVSWATSSAVLPTQTGNAGKVLMTDGSVTSWDTEIPSQTGNSGEFLTTNGTVTSWAIAGAGTSTQSATGTMTLPSGVIMKWGTTASFGDTANNAVTFATAFPNNCFVVTGSPSSALGIDGVAGSSLYGISIHTFSTTGFLVDQDGSATTVTWMAIGN